MDHGHIIPEALENSGELFSTWDWAGGILKWFWHLEPVTWRVPFAFFLEDFLWYSSFYEHSIPLFSTRLTRAWALVVVVVWTRIKSWRWMALIRFHDTFWNSLCYARSFPTWSSKAQFSELVESVKYGQLYWRFPIQRPKQNVIERWDLRLKI